MSVNDIVADLNARFATGVPSNVLTEAGVLLHTFDAMDSGRDDVWRVCSDGWCETYSDRTSASLVNKHLRSFFWGVDPERRDEAAISDAMGGFVLDSRALEPATSSMLCAWSTDAGTMGMLCDPLGGSDDCIPGCRQSFQCGTRPNMGNYCWWPPGQFEQMISAHEASPRTHSHECFQYDCNYNEVVLNAAYWTSHVPQVVEAVFFPATSVSGEAYARRVRAAFQRTFNRTDGTPPLVRLHLYGPDYDGALTDAPFELVDGGLEPEPPPVL